MSDNSSLLFSQFVGVLDDLFLDYQSYSPEITSENICLATTIHTAYPPDKLLLDMVEYACNHVNSLDEMRDFIQNLRNMRAVKHGLNQIVVFWPEIKWVEQNE